MSPQTARFGTGPSAPPPAQRAEAAGRVLAALADHQVCEGCGSILAARAAVCPVCSCYRLDPAPARVRAAALALGGKKPEPLRSRRGTAPEPDTAP